MFTVLNSLTACRGVFNSILGVAFSQISFYDISYLSYLEERIYTRIGTKNKGTYSEKALYSDFSGFFQIIFSQFFIKKVVNYPPGFIGV